MNDRNIKLHTRCIFMRYIDDNDVCTQLYKAILKGELGDVRSMLDEHIPVAPILVIEALQFCLDSLTDAAWSWDRDEGWSYEED